MPKDRITPKWVCWLLPCHLLLLTTLAHFSSGLLLFLAAKSRCKCPPFSRLSVSTPIPWVTFPCCLYMKKSKHSLASLRLVVDKKPNVAASLQSCARGAGRYFPEPLCWPGAELGFLHPLSCPGGWTDLQQGGKVGMERQRAAPGGVNCRERVLAVMWHSAG